MSQIGDPIRIVEVPDPIPANPVSDPVSPGHIPDYVPEDWPSVVPDTPSPVGAP